MHIDERKRYDKRNMENNLRGRGVLPKDYEAYLARLPDVGDKAYTPEQEVLEGGDQPGPPGDLEMPLRQKGAKKKGKG
jgi:hypothetical protein